MRMDHLPIQLVQQFSGDAPPLQRVSCQQQSQRRRSLGLLTLSVTAVILYMQALPTAFVQAALPNLPARRTKLGLQARPEGSSSSESSRSGEVLEGPDGKEPEWYKAVREGKTRQAEEELEVDRAAEMRATQKRKFKNELDGVWWFRNTFFIQIPALIFIVCFLLLTFADQLGLDPQTRMMIKATTGLIN
mmetsp:Transcript_43661/g.103026  ORF Transcript_43661/g.103026 Transcript_43661/m.103026 type:complete len:190 (-) Transcript_43661:93-662(-)|eukprot:CAMPEP_0178431632 /NCGR_PEP_ID=MMETSP0689_2-20121128/31956_1 /TAXON_ID=160604 /ORGANISM="Amphidinium massartii, Strain CS-259" /LENGTH=189 /DNA_ID=CAMNT_0020053567 /DNA_START=82 /DNA_END=651 /DNA_ORIENTATION=-